MEPTCIHKDLNLGFRVSNQREVYISALAIVFSNWIFSKYFLKIILQFISKEKQYLDRF